MNRVVVRVSLILALSAGTSQAADIAWGPVLDITGTESILVPDNAEPVEVVNTTNSGVWYEIDLVDDCDYRPARPQSLVKNIVVLRRPAQSFEDRNDGLRRLSVTIDDFRESASMNTVCVDASILGGRAPGCA